MCKVKQRGKNAELRSKLDLHQVYSGSSVSRQDKLMRSSQEAVDSVLDNIFGKCHSKLYETYLFSFVPEKVIDFTHSLSKEALEFNSL